MSRPTGLIAAASLLACAACSHVPQQGGAGAAAATAAGAVIPPWGLDLTARDPAVRPGDDFFGYADGRWLAAQTIPPDRSRWGAADELDERVQGQLLAVIAALSAAAPEGSNAQKVRDYFRAFTDESAIEARGIEPARAGIDAISAARNHHDLTRLMARPDLALRAPLRLAIVPDQKDPDRYMVTISQSGLGLPDRDYYLKDEPVYREVRAKYQAHIARILALAGEVDPPAEARDILELETRIAQVHWEAAKRRQRDLTYNPRSRAQLEAAVPGFFWETWLATAGVDAQPQFVVRESDAVERLAKLFLEVSPERWQPYFKYHYLVSVAAVLPRAFDSETFEFYGRALKGQQQQRARAKRAVSAIDSDLGEALGQLYVARYFPPAARAQVQGMVENLRAAYAVHIRAVPWMSAPTKELALQKLAAFRPKIGYPDHWRDYSSLSILPGDAFGNGVRAQMFEWRRQVSRLGAPTDRAEWSMTPQTVNAYYNPTFNEVVFPAAILQAPFFDPHADAAVNYGAIGAIIGHEMGHGFDDQGSKSDARGVLHSWWQESDTEAFRARTGALAAQYDAFEVLPGLSLNGRLTLGENIGDLGGLSISLDAYRHSLGGREAPLLDGLSGTQRFFLAYAQSWRSLQREESLRAQVLSNPHSPPRFRVNGVVRNVDAWYEAFAVPADAKLYLPPAERVRIW